MEEDEDVVEAGAEFVRQHLQVILIIGNHGEHILLDHDQPFPRQPNDVMIELERLRVSRCIKLPKPPRPQQLFRQYNGEAEDFKEHRRKVRVVIVHLPREPAEILLIDVGGGHQRNGRAQGLTSLSQQETLL